MDALFMKLNTWTSGKTENDKRHSKFYRSHSHIHKNNNNINNKTVVEWLVYANDKVWFVGFVAEHRSLLILRAMYKSKSCKVMNMLFAFSGCVHSYVLSVLDGCFFIIIFFSLSYCERLEWSLLSTWCTIHHGYAFDEYFIPN